MAFLFALRVAYLLTCERLFSLYAFGRAFDGFYIFAIHTGFDGWASTSLGAVDAFAASVFGA